MKVHNFTHAESYVWIHGTVRLDLTGSDPALASRIKLTPEQARELAADLVNAATHAEADKYDEAMAEGQVR